MAHTPTIPNREWVVRRLSITSTSMGARCDSSFRPSCSWTAVKIDGPMQWPSDRVTIEFEVERLSVRCGPQPRVPDRRGCGELSRRRPLEMLPGRISIRRSASCRVGRDGGLAPLPVPPRASRFCAQSTSNGASAGPVSVRPCDNERIAPICRAISRCATSLKRSASRLRSMASSSGAGASSRVGIFMIGLRFDVEPLASRSTSGAPTSWCGLEVEDGFESAGQRHIVPVDHDRLAAICMFEFWIAGLVRFHRCHFELGACRCSGRCCADNAADSKSRRSHTKSRSTNLDEHAPLIQPSGVRAVDDEHFNRRALRVELQAELFLHRRE